ncbi:MAG: serine/threonine protein kinase [Proteobacteria bacterium]|nr:serine/threonine protein kinase [Pseudomonadota bacterium]
MSDETLGVNDTWDGARSEGPGTRIGPYLLVRRIGEGGFGDVYEAEQRDPVKRRVALKILKLGMDTREVIARFDLERQALAVMEHPHIAHVIDAGATASGRPYFVMEYVEGIPISEYCAARKLPVEAILRLFAQVCGAVQHAHTKGIIHRDLKPGNVLVADGDDGPFAKVIDFGIAKATSGDLSQRTHATRIDQVMGTPLYMSPEQARGDADIDTRTDIYSLGVIVYELLTGTTPVEREKLAAVSLVDTQRLICESEPPRPSQRVLSKASTVSGSATFRAADPRKLAHTLRGDLDWIVMKALEKEPARRYQTAAEFAADVQRFLDGQPVLAAPPSRAYRAAKFIRRHKGPVLAAALVVASLVAGVIAFAWQARIARTQELLAQKRADDLEKLAHLQDGILDQFDPTRAGKALSADVMARYAAALMAAGVAEPARSRQTAEFAMQWQHINATDAATAFIDRSLLKPSVAAIDSQLRSDPLLAARLRHTLANRYSQLGLYDEAMPLQRSALTIRRRLLGAGDTHTLESEVDMGQVLDAQGHPGAAEPYARRAVAGYLQRFGPDNDGTLQAQSYLAQILRDQGKYDEAEAILRDVYARQARTLGADAPDTLVSAGDLGGMLIERGRPTQAEPFLRVAADGLARVNGPDDQDALTSRNNLGMALAREGKSKQAETIFREVLDRRRHVLGSDHPDTLQSLVTLGGVLQDEGRMTEAEPLLREATTQRQRIIGADAPATLHAMALYGRLLADSGHADQAMAMLDGALPTARRVLAPIDPSRLAEYLAALGTAERASRHYTEAERLLIEADAIDRKSPSGLREPIRVYGDLASLYAAWDTAEPGKGYAAKAAEWKAKLDVANAAATSAR